LKQPACPFHSTWTYGQVLRITPDISRLSKYHVQCRWNLNITLPVGNCPLARFQLHMNSHRRLNWTVYHPLLPSTWLVNMRTSLQLIRILMIDTDNYMFIQNALSIFTYSRFLAQNNSPCCCSLYHIPWPPGSCHSLTPCTVSLHQLCK
jgi:hypothetical protein